VSEPGRKISDFINPYQSRKFPEQPGKTFSTPKGPSMSEAQQNPYCFATNELAPVLCNIDSPFCPIAFFESNIYSLQEAKDILEEITSSSSSL